MRRRVDPITVTHRSHHGKNHLPDLTIFVPVFAAGRHVFWAINAYSGACE
jgi:N-methylhydantoinase B/oxoprolinase/acetone carboxylase alpha subunit